MYQQLKSPPIFQREVGHIAPTNDRVAKFYKCYDIRCLDNICIFLGDTAKLFYVNYEDAINLWGEFKMRLNELSRDRQKYRRRAEEQLKCRAQCSVEILLRIY